MFDESSTRYYRRLDWILNHPEAEANDAQLVRRLRRLRELKAEARSLKG
ncbi:MAG: hypothetical protein JWR35_164 [Marmoricola sp.]|jgi:hypothetical protein|nr:hypothetical protein [Marmoricola sp.]